MRLLTTVATVLLAAAAPAADVTLPKGFEMRPFAGPELANDIYTVHIDIDGRVVVTGRGYVRWLVDDDSDGTADRAVDLVSGLTDGPTGVLWEKDVLYLAADGGLLRFRGCDGSAPVPLKRAERLIALKTAGEHDAHAVRRGPDGKLYVLCGNMAGVSAKTITSSKSPVKEPIAGTMLRCNSDGKDVEVIAHGFRNPYSFDFGPGGMPFTYDSDNERCGGLPWYEPCRFYPVIEGGHYGWLNPQVAQTWRRPPYFGDVVPPVCTLGRGSPTGVAYYSSQEFPWPHLFGFFLADWTFGRIDFVSMLGPQSTPEPFLKATGESGFAPTGLAVHPRTGELFVSVGGRGTRGAVYRIRYAGKLGQPLDGPGLESVLRFKRTPRPFDTMLASAEAEVDGGWRVAVTNATGSTGRNRLAAVRVLQLSLGDLCAADAVGTAFEGYTVRGKPDPERDAEVGRAVTKLFPTGDANLDRELLRTAAAVRAGTDGLPAKVAATLTAASDPLDDIHALIVLARLGVCPPGTADAFLRLDAKIDKAGLTRDRHWPLRVGEAASTLTKADPTLPAELLRSPHFGRAEHVMYASLPGFDRAAAARRFAATADPEFGWQPAHVALFAALPSEEARPHLLKLWDRGGLEDSILEQLAPTPLAADRAKFVRGLRSARPVVVAASAKAVAAMPPHDANDIAELVRALGRLDPKDKSVPAVVTALRTTTSADAGPDAKAWDAWAAAKPEVAAKLAAASGLDPAAWAKRAARIDWTGGNPAEGKKVFAKATCAACHNGAAAAGPSLEGVSKRFSRDDLLTAVVNPNKDVPARYRTTEVTTTDGTAYQGIVIYEATDGLILQTATDTVRVAGSRVERTRPLGTSLMPAGLLDPLTDREVRDLFAYLRSLGPPAK